MLSKSDFSLDNSIEILYDATGQKLKKTVKTANVITLIQEYINGIELKAIGSATVVPILRLESIYNEEGRAFNTTNTTQSYPYTWRYEYNLKDHLGNTRVTFADKNNNNQIDGTSEILQESHYYAFGMACDGPWMRDATAEKYKYLYNGKELNEDFGLNLSDYGARWYDAAIGRWWSIDPLAEKTRRYTPYHYGKDNPVRFIDPDGMWATEYEKAKAANDAELAKNDKNEEDNEKGEDPKPVLSFTLANGGTADVYQTGSIVYFKADSDEDIDGNGKGVDKTSIKTNNPFNPKDKESDLDPYEISYTVVPRTPEKDGKTRFSQFGVGYGDVAMSYNTNTGLGTYSIVADAGPAKKLGENSVKANREMGIKGGENANYVMTFIFTGSRSYFQDSKSPFFTNGNLPTQTQLNNLGNYLYIQNMISIGNSTRFLLTIPTTQSYDNEPKSSKKKG